MANKKIKLLSIKKVKRLFKKRITDVREDISIVEKYIDNYEKESTLSNLNQGIECSKKGLIFHKEPKHKNLNSIEIRKHLDSRSLMSIKFLILFCVSCLIIRWLFISL